MDKNRSLQDKLPLSNGYEIPVLGFGTWKMVGENEASGAVRSAIEAGYRHIDTAAMYGNEKEVGLGIKESDVPREEIFLTTKLDNKVRGYEETIAAFEESIQKLGVEYLDLYLIHWPSPVGFRGNWQQANAESWRAMEDLYFDGRIKAIGVCNFKPHHFEALEATSRIAPMVNQIKLCPGVQDEETVAYCRERKMVIEAYSPLGKGRILGEDLLVEIGESYKKSAAQIALRWSLQKGYVPLPKSSNEGRIHENLEIYDFYLTDEEMSRIDSLHFPNEQATDPDTIEF